jgi:hypothetical protein
MTERPVIMKSPMVRALLNGWKTQTRRLATSPLRRCESGDLLWVKETWSPAATPSGYDYRAEFTGTADRYGWRPSIHMPRKASRLTLEVTEVRRQILHEISEEDALAEGIQRDGLGRHYTVGIAELQHDWKSTARQAYADLWVHLHGVDAWRENPEVVAITFTVHRKNVDGLLRERAR